MGLPGPRALGRALFVSIFSPASGPGGFRHYLPPGPYLSLKAGGAKMRRTRFLGAPRARTWVGDA